jgi:hypothetical protein
MRSGGQENYCRPRDKSKKETLLVKTGRDEIWRKGNLLKT